MAAGGSLARPSSADSVASDNLVQPPPTKNARLNPDQSFNYREEDSDDIDIPYKFLVHNTNVQSEEEDQESSDFEQSMVFEAPHHIALFKEKSIVIQYWLVHGSNFPLT